jgi:hypothetical protein
MEKDGQGRVVVIDADLVQRLIDSYVHLWEDRGFQSIEWEGNRYLCSGYNPTAGWAEGTRVVPDSAEAHSVHHEAFLVVTASDGSRHLMLQDKILVMTPEFALAESLCQARWKQAPDTGAMPVR